jgi:hypothetical protein
MPRKSAMPPAFCLQKVSLFPRVLHLKNLILRVESLYTATIRPMTTINNPIGQVKLEVIKLMRELFYRAMPDPFSSPILFLSGTMSHRRYLAICKRNCARRPIRGAKMQKRPFVNHEKRVFWVMKIVQRPAIVSRLPK